MLGGLSAEVIDGNSFASITMNWVKFDACVTGSPQWLQTDGLWALSEPPSVGQHAGNGGGHGGGHGGAHHQRGVPGWGWGGGWWGVGYWGPGWGWPYYGYGDGWPYAYGSPYAFPTAVVVSTSIAADTTPRTVASEWYFCREAGQFFPHVAGCPAGWQTVGTNSASTTRSAPLPRQPPP